MAITLLVASWAMNCAWSFTTLPEIFAPADIPNAYVTLLVTLTIGIVGNLALPGAPGLFRTAATRPLEV